MKKIETEFVWELYDKTSKIKEENIEIYLNGKKAGTAEITSNKIVYRFPESFKKKNEILFS